MNDVYYNETVLEEGLLQIKTWEGDPAVDVGFLFHLFEYNESLTQAEFVAAVMKDECSWLWNPPEIRRRIEQVCPDIHQIPAAIDQDQPPDLEEDKEGEDPGEDPELRAA